MVRSFAQHGWSSVAQENRWGSNFDNYLLSLSGAFSFRPAFWRIPQVAAQRKPIARRWWGGKRGRFHDLFVTSHRSAQVTSTSCCWEILALQRVRCTKSHWGLTVDVSWCNLWYSHLWIIDWSCLVYIYISYIFIKLLHCVKWCLNMLELEFFLWPVSEVYTPSGAHFSVRQLLKLAASNDSSLF